MNGWMSALSPVYRSLGAVYTRLEDLRCPWLNTHRLVARRVLKQPSIGSLARPSTRLKTFPFIGQPARRAMRLKNGAVYWVNARRTTRFKTVPSIGPPARRGTRLIFCWKRVMPTPGQLKLLALPVETSTSYASPCSTAGIIQPTQELI